MINTVIGKENERGGGEYIKQDGMVIAIDEKLENKTDQKWSD